MRPSFLRSPGCSLIQSCKYLPLRFFKTNIDCPFVFSYRFSSSVTNNPFPTAAARKKDSISSVMGVITEGIVAEEGLARRFWTKFRSESIFACYSPFLICLASGKLELDVFRHYIAQDFHFLLAFSQAYEKAEECADDDDDAKLAIHELRKSVLEEMEMHRSFSQEWGVDLAKESIPNTATVKYIDFLLATASGKIRGDKGVAKIATPFEKTKVAAYTVGAMTPCMRLYAFLGKEFQSLLDPIESHHPYKKWIENYSSESFEASSLQIEDLLDKLSVSLTGEELEIIEKLYHQAMKLEIEFFSTLPISQKTVVPLSRACNPVHQRLIIFSDFDLTCTVVDSSAILAEIAIRSAPKTDQRTLENANSWRSSTDLKMSWDALSKQYTEEYEQCIESIIPSEKGNEFDFEGLCQGLQKLSDFEKKANSRVIESEVLKGLNLVDIKRAGGHLKLQEGCTEFFRKVLEKEILNADIHILSYCWCADLIKSAFSAGGLDTLNIHSNEFTYEKSISTGEIISKVESPLDKIQVFREILKNSGEGKPLSVYIGDSVGDLLCLLEADVGIVIGSSPSLRNIGRHFGVTFVPLFPALIKKQGETLEENSSIWKGMTGTLYCVSTWAEIHAFIIGS